VLLGYPPDSQLFALPLVAGRAPAANARDELIVTRMVLDIRPDVRLGSVLELDFRGRRSSSRVVGVVDQIGAMALYAPYAGFEAATAQDAANALRVKVTGADVRAVSEALDRQLLEAKMPATQLIDRTLIRDAFDEHFSVVGTVLRMIALAAALLGLLILVGSATFDVFERRREIGVLRSLGASRRAIVNSFLVEGSIVLGISAALAVGLSVALTLLALEAASRTLLHVPIPLLFSLSGCVILGGGVLLGAAAVRAAVSFAFRESITEAMRLER
jgi:putative ABC transport system permease protein